MSKSSKDLSSEHTLLQSQIGELKQKCKDQIKNSQQQDIFHEKEMFKLNAKCKEYKYIIHEQKNSILQLDEELAVKKHLESVGAQVLKLEEQGENLNDD